jgi:hypothetical protein
MTFLTQFIVMQEKNEGNCWFQQDGVTAHTATTAADFLALLLQ